MFVRKVLVGLVAAGLSAGALAQQSDAGKTDLFGRPYVSQTPTEIYYQSDPFTPLPQIEQLRHAQREAAGAGAQAAAVEHKDIFGRPQLNQSASEVYFNADPFDPLPQLQPLYRRASEPSTASTQSAAASRTDAFGRPYAGFDAQQAYHDIDPYAPLPQFWNQPVKGVGAVASKPGPTKLTTETSGTNG